MTPIGKPSTSKVLITAKGISSTVAGMASAFNDSSYLSKTFPLVVPILEGGSVFALDLIRRLTFPLELRSARFSSYVGIHKSTKPQAEVFPYNAVKGRTVIFVDDICDSGATLEACKNLAFLHGASDVKTCTLLRRIDSPFSPDFVGFTVAKGLWVFGYGMDYKDNQLRYTPDIEYVTSDEESINES